MLITEKDRSKIDNQVKKLKKKFLKNENVVFHSRDMSRKKGPFSIFKDKKSVTSLCLVTKANQDSSIQIADALGAIAGMYSGQAKPKNRIEQIKIRLIERKLQDPVNPSYLESML